MKEQIGLNFAAALRSFLRQDPNIILVGEIRDFETAEIAVKAALTGHLVLSTLHTNDAPATISRLMNVGIEPFLVATSVHLICAQRLVRRICSECRTEDEITPQVLIDASFSPEEAKTVKVYKGAGCAVCANRGYKGRVGLYEVLEINDEIRELVLVGASAGHCHVNRVGPQRPAWIPFQAAALALSHTLNASFRNRLNVSLLRKCRWT